MKKLILSLGLLAGVSVAAQAQSATFGVKAGASLTNFTGKGVGSDVKNVFGFNGGLIANFGVNDAFSIQPEVLYSMKGAKTSYSISGTSVDDKVRLHYIDVPVLARIKAGGLFFELGPQVGFLLSANEKMEANGQSQSQDIKSSLKTVDFGYAGGLGYQLDNGPGIGIRYNGGFSDIDKNSSSSSATRNSAFQLYLTYMFGGK
jgi:hypothetical protein